MTIHNLFGKQPIDVSKLDAEDAVYILDALLTHLGIQVFEDENGLYLHEDEI